MNEENKEETQQPTQPVQPVQPQQPQQPEGFTQEFQNPDLPILPSVAELPDMEQFEGARIKIEGWDTVEINSIFNPDTGERMNTPITVTALKVFSESLGEGKRSDGTTFPIRATTIFNLKKDKEGKMGLSSHPSSNIQKFFRKLKINTLAEMKGKFITVTIDESGWARIVY